MALANLNINVNANVSNVVNAMADVKAVTNASMFKSSEAVNNFQKAVTADSAKIQTESKALTSELKNTSVEVAKSAQVSTETMKGVTTSADASVASLKDLTKGLGTAGQQLTKAMGPEAAAEMKGVTDKIEEFILTRAAIAAVGVALGAVAGTIAGVGYAAYKATGFLAGLITGESYKSKNIDEIIKLNDKVLDLQKTLQMTAADASAMNDVLNRTGISKSDITDVYSKTQAMRGGGDKSEFDRLGVNYKNTDGSIADTATIIENAKNKLAEYTDGWHRNQAAVALGLGSYDQLNSYLKINQQEIQNSKDRLNDYYLSVGPEAQKFITEYQQAMRDFKNEQKLMGDSMSRVWADQVMPAYTKFAESFKDGWPTVVAGVRHTVAAFVSLGYGLKMSFDMVYDVLDGIFKAVGGGIAAIAAANHATLTGDWKGASLILVAGWEDAKGKLKGIGGQIAEDAKNNLAAMKLAQGQYAQNLIPAGMPGSDIKPGKNWEPKPKEPEAEDVKNLKVTQSEEERAFIARDAAWRKQMIEESAAEEKALLEAQIAAEESLIMADSAWRAAMLKDRLDSEEAAKFTAYSKTMDSMSSQQKMSEGDIYGAESEDLKKRQEERLLQIQSFAEKEKWTNEQKNAAIAASDELYAAQKKKLDSDTAKTALSSLSNSLSSLGDTLMKGNKEQFEAGKKMAIASATISMTLGAVQAYTSMASIPYVGPALGAVAAAAVLAAGAVNIATIKAQEYQGKALGGSVAGGTTYLVGERGPELFTPGASGQITSNDKLAKLGGGNTVNTTQVFQISPGLSGTVQAEIMRFVPLFRKHAEDAVYQSINNGGRLASAVGRM